MLEISNLTMDIAASLWFKPANWDDLYSRKIESIKTSSEYMFDKVLNLAKSKGYIYQKDEIFYCYKKTVVNVLNPAGYGINLHSDTMSDFRKDFDRLFGNAT